MWCEMKTTIGRFVLIIGMALVLAACSPEGPDLSEDLDLISVGAAVWIDAPLDQSTIPPTHTAVVAHANVPDGISAFQFWVNGNLLTTYPLTGDDYGASFAVMTQAWLPSGQGWQVLKVGALGMLGEEVASTEIDVFIGFDEPDNGEEPPVDEQAALTPTPTTGPDYSRCDLFDPDEITLTMFDILPGSTAFTAYIGLPFAVPGLEEPVLGDNDPWLYSALLGSTESEECSFQGYSGRVYCSFDLPESAMDTIQPLSVFINLCEVPIFYHPRVSIIAPVCEADMNQADCEATGGSHSCIRDICTCTCP